MKDANNKKENSWERFDNLIKATSQGAAVLCIFCTFWLAVTLLF